MYRRRLDKEKLEARPALQDLSLNDDDDDSWLSTTFTKTAACSTPPDTARFAGRSKGKKKDDVPFAAEDAVWLSEALKRRAGFGTTVAVRLPKAWRRSRRARAIAWCEHLGFRSVARLQGGRFVADAEPLLEIEARLVPALLAHLDALKLEDHQTVVTPVHSPASASPRSKLRRRRSIAARKASLLPEASPVVAAPKQQQRRPVRGVVVGAWLTGEARDGRCVVDGTRLSVSGATVVRVSRGRALVATRSSGAVTVAIDEASKVRCWPSGWIARAVDDDTSYYVAEPTRLLETGLVRAVLDYLDDAESVVAASAACWNWSRAAEGAMAALAGSLGSRELSRWTRVLGLFPRGEYLAEGAFKRVYKVDGAALSVADLDLLGDEATAAAARELEASFLATSLGRRVPNFVATTAAFECDCAPPKGGWTSKRKTGGDCGHFLYAEMELCNGDLQDWVADQPDALPDVAAATSIAFQMCFAVYAARASYAMRHYDLKLLNFLAAPRDDKPRAYWLGSQRFFVDAPVVPKLADFGTARFGAATLNTNANGELWTTIENVPVELFTHGASADVHAFAADTFSLGLAVLHLFTGDRPYEEILHDVRCPPPLCAALAGVWLSGRKKHTCRALARVLRDCPADDDAVIVVNRERLDRLFFDTFYRFVVLFGLPDEDPYFQASEVWRATRRLLASNEDRPKRCGGQDPRQDYEADVAEFSLATGTHPSIARARRRLDTIDGADVALRSMLHFDPNKRPTLRALLASPFFAGLHQQPSKNDAAFCIDVYHHTNPVPDV